jgi:hypothetical protein
MIGGEPAARRHPPFNPALLVEQATRRLDLAEGGRGLLAALTVRDAVAHVLGVLALGRAGRGR